MQQTGLCSENSIEGSIKNHPEDFVVEEISLYEPCGSGEHVYLSVRKTNLSHDALLNLVARALNVSIRAIGYAGRKDLYATTTQMLSAHLPGIDVEIPNDLGNVELLWQSRHTNKLRLGHLLGNRFKIKIRNVEEEGVGIIQERMRRLSTAGIPNAFGPQRFGNLKNNHHLGKALLMEDWDQIIELLIGDDEVLAQRVAKRRSRGAITKPLRKLWVNSLQSAIYNGVLEQRIVNGTWNTPLIGDLVCKHGARGRTFEVTAEDIDSAEFQSRVASVEISPTGPIWGKKMREPACDVFVKEMEILNLFGLTQSQFATTKQYGMGTRRPLRVPVTNTEVTEGSDTNGLFVLATFELPAGSYATTLIESLLNASL